MKKQMHFVLITVCAVFFVAFAAESQRDLFDVYLTTGYGFGMGGNAVLPTFTGTNLATATTRTDHFLNLGRGLKVEAGADYKLMDHLYAQGAVNYTLGVPGISAKQITAVTTTYDYDWSIFGFKVMLKPTFQVLDLIDIYTNIGIGLFFANSTMQGSQGASAETRHDTYAPAFAMTGAIGMNYPLNASIILFGEIVCEQMSFTLEKSEYTNANGVFGNYTVNYEEDVTSSQTPLKIPATNVALRVGVKFPIF